MSDWQKIVFVFTLLFLVARFHEQSVDQSVKANVQCDHTIASHISKIDGNRNYSSINPGHIVCMPSGRRGILQVKNIHGTRESPVTFINSGGVVTITGDSTERAIEFSNSSHIRFTGTGTDDFYGFNILGTIAGVTVGNWTSDFEVDHIKIQNTDRSGVKLLFKTSYNWIHHNFYIHHVYIRNVSTGMYLGVNFKDPEHPIIKGLEVSYNYIEDNQCGGIKVKPAIENVKVHHNTIIDSGHKPPGYPTDREGCDSEHAIVIQPTSVGDYYNNLIIDSAKCGFRTYGEQKENIKIFNNTIVDSGINGILLANSGSAGSAYNNIVVNSGEDGIIIGNSKTSGEVYNNIIAVSVRNHINNKSNNVNTYDNLTFDSINSLKFVNPSNRDFHLKAGSPAIDAASSTGFPSSDLDDISKPQGLKADIGVYEYSQTTSPSPLPPPSHTACTIPQLLSGWPNSTFSYDLNGDGKTNGFDFGELLRK